MAWYKDPVMITEGKMQYLFDETGRRYLDVSVPVPVLQANIVPAHVLLADARQDALRLSTCSQICTSTSRAFKQTAALPVAAILCLSNMIAQLTASLVSCRPLPGLLPSA